MNKLELKLGFKKMRLRSLDRITSSIKLLDYMTKLYATFIM